MYLKIRQHLCLVLTIFLIIQQIILFKFFDDKKVIT